MPIRNYKDLIVWQKAMDLSVEIYRLVKKIAKRRIVLFIRSDETISNFNSKQYCRREIKNFTERIFIFFKYSTGVKI